MIIQSNEIVNYALTKQERRVSALDNFSEKVEIFLLGTALRCVITSILFTAFIFLTPYFLLQFLK